MTYVLFVFVFISQYPLQKKCYVLENLHRFMTQFDTILIFFQFLSFLMIMTMFQTEDGGTYTEIYI